MLALQIIAVVLLLLSALLLFGPQLVAYGPRALPNMARSPEARFISVSFASLIVLALVFPTFMTAMISGGQSVYAVTAEMVTMDFGLV